jgi:hypothetical protein
LSEELWRKIVEVHNQTKLLLLMAEEMEVSFNDFLAPVLQQRDTLEHIIRAKAAEIGIRPVGDPGSYVEANLDKALGHAYRAFFDVADWSSVIIREKVLNVLKPFPPEAIASGLPTYYAEIRPRIEDLSLEIANIRNSKDIGGDDVLEEVRKYQGVVEELQSMWKKIRAAIPSIQECSRKSVRAKFLSGIWILVVAIAGAAIGAILTAVLTPSK